MDEERVYFVFRNNAGPNQGDGRIIALDKATGRLLWQQDLPHGKGNTAPVPMNNVVIVGDTGGWVSAFDKRTGRPVTYGGYPLYSKNSRGSTRESALFCVSDRLAGVTSVKVERRPHREKSMCRKASVCAISVSKEASSS